MVVLCLGIGIIYSIALRFPQIRLFKSMVHYLMRGSASEDGISSFQAFAMALGGRVGVGNISGVATAILWKRKQFHCCLEFGGHWSGMYCLVQSAGTAVSC